MILYLIECETFITIKTVGGKRDRWMKEDRGEKEMVVEDEGEDRRDLREKKKWRKEKTTEELNECPSADGVVI